MSVVPRLNLAKLDGFPEIEDDGKIKTEAFIKASNEIIELIENFGRLFYPVVADMRGNADRLMAHYEKDKNKRKYIDEMILDDASSDEANKLATISWLLWLKRALEFIERFFGYVLDDEELISEKSDDLVPAINKSYKEVLKPYHGYLLQKTFGLMNRWMPGRMLLLGTEANFQENINHLQRLMPTMRCNIDKINEFYNANNLNDTSKV